VPRRGRPSAKRTRKGWPRKGFYSKAQWRYYWATNPTLARRLARATPGGKGTRYRRLPARRPGQHVVLNSRRTGFLLPERKRKR
jgi:hypothetical protein